MQRVLITGANRGIGRALAVRYARAGYAVDLGCRNPSDGVEALAEAQAAGGPNSPCRIVTIDMADVSSIHAAAEHLLIQAPPDVLINNAGVHHSDLLTHHSDEDITRLLTINLEGPVQLTRRLLPAMIARGSGQIVNHASMVWVGLPGSTVYSAAKAGIFAFSEGLRRELKGTGVSVTTLLTPVVESDMSRTSRDTMQSRGWLKTGKLPQHPYTSTQYVEDIFPALERQASTIMKREARLLSWLQRLAPRLLDAVCTRVYRRFYPNT
jgi:short-subunit dehydrogenase